MKERYMETKRIVFSGYIFGRARAVLQYAILQFYNSSIIVAIYCLLLNLQLLGRCFYGTINVTDGESI